MSVRVDRSTDFRKFEIQKYVETNIELDEPQYLTVKTIIGIEDAINTLNTFVQNNPSYCYRLIRVIIDEVRSSKPIE